MSERDYYEILGLRFDADGTAVNRTYWLLARKYQAQAGSDPRAHQMLDELNEAYAVLGTPALRAAYDAAHPEFADPDYVAHHELESVGGQPVGAFAVGAPGLAARGSLNIGALAPYVAAAIVGFASVGAGLWAGSLLLAGLGAGGAILLGAAYAKHKMSSGRAVRPMAYTSHEAFEPAPTRSASPPKQEARKAPLNSSIVKRRAVSADELRLSTASMVGRWRSTVAVANPDAGGTEARPDPTLVDIFRSEEELETPSEPLSAVLDVLRGSRHPV